MQKNKIEVLNNMNILRETMKRKIANEISALEAVEIFVSEDIEVPQTILLQLRHEINTVSIEECRTILERLTNALEKAGQIIQDKEQHD